MKDELRQAAASCRGGLTAVIGLSAILNMLTLAGSLYMMLIYDLVIPGRSTASLVGLLAIVTLAYIAQGFGEVLRSRIQRQGADVLSSRICERAMGIARRQALIDAPRQDDPTRHLSLLRAFMSGQGPSAVLDLPWMFVFIAVIWLLHPWLGMTTLAGAVMLAGLTWITQRRLKTPGTIVETMSTGRMLDAEERRRTARLARALGMEDRLDKRALEIGSTVDEAHERLAAISSAMSGTSRTVRMLLQSVVLTVGALLVIQDKATGGVIFASSILSARALAPVDQIIGNWRGLMAAKGAWESLSQTLARQPEPAVPLPLPDPGRNIRVVDLSVVLDGRRIVDSVSFELRAGQALALVGPSAAGKTTLLTAIVGALQADRGEIRMDDADIRHWDPSRLGPHLGYLPQDVQLLRGTVADNIRRFDSDADAADVVAAAQTAGAHEMILGLPDGYDTLLGENGGGLSAGQRQRVGLARALFGKPFLVVLDEPNSNLDVEGEIALSRAIIDVRRRGGIAIVASHRASVLNAVDMALVLQEGRVQGFGPRDAVLQPQAISQEKAA